MKRPAVEVVVHNHLHAPRQAPPPVQRIYSAPKREISPVLIPLAGIALLFLVIFFGLMIVLARALS